MSLRNLWILAVVSLVLVADRLIPHLGVYKLQLGVLGLIVSAVLAYRGMKSNQNVSEYRWILGIAIAGLLVILMIVVGLFFAFNGFRFM